MIYERILWVVSLVACAVWAYNLGTINSGLNNQQLTTTTYLKQNDRGCNDIIKHQDGALVCEVDMVHEDDALYIIKLTGAKDDY